MKNLLASYISPAVLLVLPRRRITLCSVSLAAYFQDAAIRNHSRILLAIYITGTFLNRTTARLSHSTTLPEHLSQSFRSPYHHVNTTLKSNDILN